MSSRVHANSNRRSCSNFRLQERNRNRKRAIRNSRKVQAQTSRMRAECTQGVRNNRYNTMQTNERINCIQHTTACENHGEVTGLSVPAGRSQCQSRVRRSNPPPAQATRPAETRARQRSPSQCLRGACRSCSRCRTSTVAKLSTKSQASRLTQTNRSRKSPKMGGNSKQDSAASASFAAKDER